jgi:DNA processing protein
VSALSPDDGRRRGSEGEPEVLPSEAWLVALAGLPEMGPVRLAALLQAWSPEEAWRQVCVGRAHVALVDARHGQRRRRSELGELGRVWAREAARSQVGATWRRHVEAGVGVAAPARASYPPPLLDDPARPPVLFHLGDPDVVAGARVAIVGTRSCTRYGSEVARGLGRDLADAGVAVVSGLAAGIDAAAHTGALEARGAPPIGVVGSGLDVPYPRQNASLWRRVAVRGVLWSEYPLGTRPAGWHFPSRNRLLAALADVVVVVESHRGGGSMHTVSEAQRRDVPVLAVPGPVTSPSSEGTNQLLFDGAGPARDVTDVLVHLGLSAAGTRSAAEQRAGPDPVAADVLDAVGWQPCTVDHLLVRTRLDLGELSLALDRLEAQGWVACQGGWIERVSRARR